MRDAIEGELAPAAARRRALRQRKGGMHLIPEELLSPFVEAFLKGVRLTPAERDEVLRIAQGFACKDSAAALGVSPGTIRERRNRIYRRLRVAGSGELSSTLLARALAELGEGPGRVGGSGDVPVRWVPGKGWLAGDE